MQDLDKDVMKMYQQGEDDPFVHEKMQLDLNKHTGCFHPVAPAFGIPLMRFSEDPVEAFNSGTMQINNYQELKAIKKYIHHYQQNKYAVNLKRAVHGSSPMRAQIYERKKLDHAKEIIDKSFTYGAKLQRNPISNKEKELQDERDREETERFELFKRAWFLRKRKATSIGSYITTDKNEFDIDWDEMVAKKLAKESNKRNDAKQRSSIMESESIVSGLITSERGSTKLIS